MHLEKKKKQHFVWRYYLRKWANNERIFCLMDQKIFATNLMNIGQEKYFYRLKELTNPEIQVLSTLIKKNNTPMLRKLNQGWINFFDMVFEIKKNVDKAERSDSKINQIFDVLICNFEEDFQGSIESTGIEFLEKLYKKDLSFYKNDEKLISFLFFICQQYFRTQKIQTNVISALKQFKNLNIEVMWPVLRHISATSVGFSLFADRNDFYPIIIENQSNLPLITGDQPVINTYANGLSLNEEAKDLEFYYPLSPKMAFLLTPKEKYKGKSVISFYEKDVMEYNRYSFDQSGRQVYASNQDVLKGLLV